MHNRRWFASYSARMRTILLQSYYTKFRQHLLFQFHNAAVCIRPRHRRKCLSPANTGEFTRLLNLPYLPKVNTPENSSKINVAEPRARASWSEQWRQWLFVGWYARLHLSDHLTMWSLVPTWPIRRPRWSHQVHTVDFTGDESIVFLRFEANDTTCVSVLWQRCTSVLLFWYSSTSARIRRLAA